jgi:cytoskeletal protein CcmA (bactofilin family)
MDPKPAEQPPALLQPPAAPPPPSPALGRQTFLGRGVTIRGQIVASEDLFIDGVIEAPIHCKSHSITFGPNSRIAGNVEAKSVDVRGEMEGDIRADQSVHIGRGALVTGSVRAQSVQLDPSARVRVQLLVGMGPETSK